MVVFLPHCGSRGTASPGGGKLGEFQIAECPLAMCLAANQSVLQVTSGIFRYFGGADNFGHRSSCLVLGIRYGSVRVSGKGRVWVRYWRNAHPQVGGAHSPSPVRSSSVGPAVPPPLQEKEEEKEEAHHRYPASLSTTADG